MADPLEVGEVVHAIVNGLVDAEIACGHFLPQSVQGCLFTFDRRAKRKNESPSFAFREFHVCDYIVASSPQPTQHPTSDLPNHSILRQLPDTAALYGLGVT